MTRETSAPKKSGEGRARQPYRSASDEQKAAALARLDANAGNVLRTARELSLPPSTLRGWDDAAEAARDGGAVADIRHQKREELAERLESFAHLCLDAIPDKIADAPLSDAMRALGIAIDKMLLLKGRATEIVATETLTPEEARARLAELLMRGHERWRASEESKRNQN